MCKNGLHEIHGPADLMSGECARCYRMRQSRFHQKRRDGAALMDAIERRAEKLRTQL